HAPDIQHPRRASEKDEHDEEGRAGVQPAIQPVADGNRHDQRRDQLHPHAQTDPERGRAEIAGLLPDIRRGLVEPLSGASRTQTVLEGTAPRRTTWAALLLAHVRSWQVALPEGVGLLTVASGTVK